MAILGALAKIFIPLLLIAGAAYFFLVSRPQRTAQLRVTTSVPGADILIGGLQTGFVTDTTMTIRVGRQIVTVRKQGYVTDPEFRIVEINAGQSAVAAFVLREPSPNRAADKIKPLAAEPTQTLSTGEPLHSIPPAGKRPSRRLVDFAPSGLESLDQDKESAVQPVTPEEAQGISETEVSVTSTPGGAVIWVNGVATTRSTPYTFRGLDRGVYSFRVRRAGYTAIPDSVLIGLVSDNQNELIAFKLSPDSSLPQPTISIVTTPIAAGIRLDGRSVGIGQASLKTEFGPHRVEFAEIPGYRAPDAVSLSITDDDPSASVKGEYVRLVGDAYVAVKPSDDVQQFDPAAVRIRVDGELLLDGSDQKFDAALVGHLLSGKRLIQIQYGDLTSDIHVDLINGQVAEIVFRIESFFSKRKLRLRDRSVIPLEEWREQMKKATVLAVS